MEPYDFAVDKIKQAGEMLIAAREKGFEVSTKGGNARDIVTSTDKEVSEFLISAIKKEFPNHDVYSEEASDAAKTSEFQWVIDPIDGSSNFSRGIPHFSICIGLLQNDVPVIGVVYNPVTQELFSFKKGEGAFFNGKPMHVSGTATLAQAQVIFSPGGRKRELWDWAAASYRKLLEHSLKRAMYGSSALDLCFLAAGRADVVIYGTLSTRDIAAALGILYEAGGVASDAKGEPVLLTRESQKIYLANSKLVLEEVRMLLES
jgi:fructose-1,6-bisphosphatase/inositol monophosphatase family enzyme